MAQRDAVDAILLGKDSWKAFRAQHGHTIDLSRAALRECDLSGLNLRGVELTGADLEGTDFTSADLSGVAMSEANVAKAKLLGANLNGCNLVRANLANAVLSSADIRQANLTGANLTNAVLLQCRVDDGTNFANASVEGARIERRTLIRMPNYGRLTAGQMMDMDIIDPVAKMRSYYSGVWQWIHAGALALFAAPYLFFVVRKYLAASVMMSFAPSPNTIPLWQALATFIWTGGTGANFAPVPVAIFFFSVLYNGLRAALLFKTKTLELQEQASGLPAPFSLGRPWGPLLVAANWGFFANLALVLYHTGHFLQVRVAP